MGQSAGSGSENWEQPIHYVRRDLERAFLIDVAIGTYTSRHPFGSPLGRFARNLMDPRPRSAGIYCASFDPVTGGFGEPYVAATIANPSWLARHPTLPLVYAVSELPEGSITALRVADGHWHQAATAPSAGAAPCHVSVDPAGRFLCAANYSSGSVIMVALDPDGKMTKQTHTVAHSGRGPHPRQRSAHPHSACIAPDGKWLLVPDLGADGIFVYRVQPDVGPIPAGTPFFPTVAGAGPRHLAFHPAGGMVLVINELNNTLVSYRFDEASGRLNFVHGISTLPKGMEAPSTAADVRIHPNGSLAFVSNRGFDAITTIAIESTGRMEVASFVKTGGRVPRGIAIDPAGAFLMAAHQASDEVMAFSIDARRGNLETVARVSVPTSVCVQCL